MQKKTPNRYLISIQKQQKTFEQNSRELTKAWKKIQTARFNYYQLTATAATTTLEQHHQQQQPLLHMHQ